MIESMKPCQHTFSDDVVYKEVVVIGNGPSGIVTSFMLAGNVPYLKEIPDHLPIDDMLRVRLQNIPKGQSLYEVDLMQLAEGLEGRSQNPIPLLMDCLWRPCADMGINEEPLIEWRYDDDKQIDHIVLGRGPPGGSWHTFPPTIRTLSPAAWLSLPPHAAPATHARLAASQVADYCRGYVKASQRYFREGVVVEAVTAQRARGHCHARGCARAARFCVSGYDTISRRPFRYACRRVALACGANDRPNTLRPSVAMHAVHSLASLHAALKVLAHASSPPRVLVMGSGVSAADAVRLTLRTHSNKVANGSNTANGNHAANVNNAAQVAHVHRAPSESLASLPPNNYADYCKIYKMMCDGPSGNHKNYTSYPDHDILEVTPIEDAGDIYVNINSQDIKDHSLQLKRVKLINLVTKEVTEITVSLIAVLIGSKPDLSFLQTNFNLDLIKKTCTKCSETKHAAKRKMDDTQTCFFRNHWHYIKTVLGQSIQSCKNRYLNVQDMNGNTETKCIVPNCNDNLGLEWDCEKCELNSLLAGGIGFGLDPKKEVDGRTNPLAIDKSTHELLHAPKGIYALGPLTADNFIRFIPGGALAIVSSIHREMKEDAC